MTGPEKFGRQPSENKAMRLFVALDLDTAVINRLQQALNAYRERAPQARWTRIESLHLTLKFIGEVPATDEERVTAALEQIRQKPFPLEFSGLGAFPQARHPRVFWAGIRPSTELEQLAHSIEQLLLPLGIAAENRAFSPHLTLARGRTPDELRPLMPLLQETTPHWGRQIADRYYLYQSHPSRGAYQYEKRREFPLVSPG